MSKRMHIVFEPPGSGNISPHDSLIACSTRRPPLALHLTALRFAGQPPLLRAKGWPRRRADGTLNGRLPDHTDEPVYGIPCDWPPAYGSFPP